MPTKEEIIWVLSGGRSNRDPDESLGGKPSTTVITDGLNNLFDDVSRSEIRRGNIDYRCFYVKNGSNETWQNVQIYISSQTEDGAFGYVGVALADDEQQFSVIADDDVEGGYFTFDFEDNVNIRVNYNSDLDTWAANFQLALRSLPELRDVEVSGLYFPNHSTTQYQNKTFYAFRVYFTGRDGKRNQPYIYPNTNNLVVAGGGESQLKSYKTIIGAPSNTEAVKVSSEDQRPDNVLFNLTSKDAPIQLGDLRPGEYLPVWIMRENFPEAVERRNDIITIALRGASTII